MFPVGDGFGAALELPEFVPRLNAGVGRGGGSKSGGRTGVSDGVGDGEGDRRLAGALAPVPCPDGVGKVGGGFTSSGVGMGKGVWRGSSILMTGGGESSPPARKKTSSPAMGMSVSPKSR